MVKKWFVLCLGLLHVMSLPGSAGVEVKAYRDEVFLLTYPWRPDIPYPYFPETDKRTIYPYTMQDNLRPEAEERTYPTVVLENEFLKLIFIPALGGRLWKAVDKVTGKPVFYVNNVVKPGLIGMRGAWISGGVEFNTGPQGHTVSAISPVDVLMLPPQADGSRSVAIGEVDRIYRLPWTVMVTLRPGRRFIEEEVVIYNPNPIACPYYFWNCTAQPNTPGFRFIYPMTLGTDHGGKRFYSWPIDKGVDLSWAKHYREMSSIFAHGCDQDFFGSYDVDADRGCVAYADHHQLPGKKAWTWGWGGDGVAHQRMLTDDDGPYNEVQTGPLPTQADTGRLEPHEAIRWKEWWYPVHGLGDGFTFASRDICANAKIEGGTLTLRLLGTGTFRDASVSVSPRSQVKVKGESGTTVLASWLMTIDPFKPQVRTSQVGVGPVEVTVSQEGRPLAVFSVPLALPKRVPPDPESEAAAASRGVKTEDWPRRLRAVHENFEKALADPEAALQKAWGDALQPETAVSARARIARILLRTNRPGRVVETLGMPGPWQSDPVCLRCLAAAYLQLEKPEAARTVLVGLLKQYPLDVSAWYLMAKQGNAPARKVLERLDRLLDRDPECVLHVAFELMALGLEWDALSMLKKIELEESPMLYYTVNYLHNRLGRRPLLWDPVDVPGVFPSRPEALPVLRFAVENRPDDALARRLLGDLLFHLKDHDAAEQLWREAIAKAPADAVSMRSLGMALWRRHKDMPAAEGILRRALSCRPEDGILGRDLARVLMAQADQAGDGDAKKAFRHKARKVLLGVLPANEHRADILEMTCRLHNLLDEPEKAADLLDWIAVTNWEGAQGLHDEFRKAHMTLGKKYLTAKKYGKAAGAFRRSLSYPDNLGIGKRDGTKEEAQQFLLGKAAFLAGKIDIAHEAWGKAADEMLAQFPKHEGYRTKGYTRRSADAARAWQAEVRAQLFKLLKLDGLLAKRASIPFDVKEVRIWKHALYVAKELTINSTPGRRMTVILTQPVDIKKPGPAVVCLGGHGSTLRSPYGAATLDKSKQEAARAGIYKGFGTRLAERGYVTISTTVSQHNVHEAGRLLMGERLWDCMRCVDFLQSLPAVDKARIGCAGLSLGGEMTMWLGAMDTRIKAVVSAGFLTFMDHMEHNHCMCWKFDGLRPLVDFPDIYALTAPRALMCQNGLKEPRSQFYVPLAYRAWTDVRKTYEDMGAPGKVILDVHGEGHVIDLPELMTFFDGQLARN